MAAAGKFNPNYPLDQKQRHSREGGNPALQTAREADNISVLYRFAGVAQSTGFPPSRE